MAAVACVIVFCAVFVATVVGAWATFDFWESVPLVITLVRWEG